MNTTKQTLINLVTEWYLDTQHVRQAQVKQISEKPPYLETKVSGMWYWAYDPNRNIIYARIPERKI